MSNELLATKSNSLMMWDDAEKIQEIKKIFAPTLSDTEFQIFVGMGKATGLNPFTREIWAVKYDNSQAQIFIGRDGYRKAAQAHSEYDYHQADAVYANDGYEVVNGEVRHSYNLADRGRLVGAYCIAKRHKSSRPMYVFCDLSEYDKKQSVWKEKPATMIKKVAEAQCLRACFQDLFGGSYVEDEIEQKQESAKAPKSDEVLDIINKSKSRTFDATPVEETGEVATPEQVKQIHVLINEKGFNQNGRLLKALTHYGVETIGQLTSAQAQDFIEKMQKDDKSQKGKGSKAAQTSEGGDAHA